MPKGGAGGAHCLGGHSSQCFSTHRKPCVRRPRGSSKVNTEAPGRRTGGWWSTESLAPCRQPLAVLRSPSAKNGARGPISSSPFPTGEDIPLSAIYFHSSKNAENKTHNYVTLGVWGPSGKGLCQSCICHVWGQGNRGPKC